MPLATRPNVVVVLLDDHAQWALSCYGNAEIRTPTLDHLAATGVRMANAFTPTPVCSPARACFLTGRLASQHGVHDYLDVWNPEVGERAWLHGQTTLPELLQAGGYTTALSGKWHLGRGFERQPGFDYWYECGDTRSSHRPAIADTPTASRCDSVVNYDRHAITDHAVEFLRTRDTGKPFFLYVGYIATHSPWRGQPERIAASYRHCEFADVADGPMYPFGRLSSESLMPTRNDRREALAQYYAAVTAVDEQVGRIVDELEAQATREDTLLLYTSDHGLSMGQHGVWGKGNGTKPYNMLEESIRVPLILNQPGTILGGQTREEMVTHCDLFATVAEHVALDVPAPPAGMSPSPGRSFDALLAGGAVADWPQVVFGEYGPLRMARTRTHKLLIRHPDGPHELFDLVADPGETVNRLGDPELAAVARGLRVELDSYFARHEDPERSGLLGAGLPSFNKEEVWRYPDADDTWWLALPAGS
jgi:arylsulfatase A-like enzyme